MNSKLVTAVFCSMLVIGCSKTPHLGETTTQTSVPGLTTTEYESRSLLPDGGLAGEDSVLQQMSAKVEAVNKQTRVITIVTEDGKKTSFTLGKEVQNLPQIRVGDIVTVDFFESVAFEVRKPTASELAASTSREVVAVGAKASKGSRPAAVVVAGDVTVLTIEKIDKENQIVTFRGPKGQLVSVRAKHRENLSMAKPGDTVVVTRSELIAAKVSPVS